MNMFRDYKEMVWKPQIEFMKRHWKGYALTNVVVCTAIMGATFVYANQENIKRQINTQRAIRELKKTRETES